MSAFKLVWGDRVIPLEIARHQEEDPKSGETYFLGRFGAFGGSAIARHKGKIPNYSFASAEERRAAQMLAVEASLVYSGNYNGDTRPEGYDRFEFEGRIYTKKDFGIP